MNTHVPYLIIVYTRYAGSTDTKGSRIIATSNHFGKKGKVEHRYLDEYSGEENHKTAAFKFIGKFLDLEDKGKYDLIGVSDHPAGSGNAWIFKRTSL